MADTALSATPTVVITGNLVVDLQKHAVATRAGIPITLTQKEMAVLVHLCLNKTQVVSKTQLYQALYQDGETPEAGVIDVFMCRLRRKIEAGNKGVSHIYTVRGKGYTMYDPAADHRQT